jgi:hypothetical protein
MKLDIPDYDPVGLQVGTIDFEKNGSRTSINSVGKTEIPSWVFICFSLWRYTTPIPILEQPQRLIKSAPRIFKIICRLVIRDW